MSVIASKHGWDDDEWMDGWMVYNRSFMFRVIVSRV